MSKRSPKAKRKLPDIEIAKNGAISVALDEIEEAPSSVDLTLSFNLFPAKKKPAKKKAAKKRARLK